jgi:hypothetical protein
VQVRSASFVVITFQLYSGYVLSNKDGGHDLTSVSHPIFVSISSCYNFHYSVPLYAPGLTDYPALFNYGIALALLSNERKHFIFHRGKAQAGFEMPLVIFARTVLRLFETHNTFSLYKGYCLLSSIGCVLEVSVTDRNCLL